MTRLYDWITAEKDRLYRFEDWWRDGQKFMPSVFPNDMSDEEWDKRYRDQSWDNPWAG